MSDTGASALEGDEQLETGNLRFAGLKTTPRPAAGAKIDAWQSQTEQSSNYPEPADHSLVARLCANVLDLLHEVTRQAPKRDSVPKSISVGLERVRGLITLWSDGYGIKEGNLGHVFAKSRSIRRSTLKILLSIANTLINRLIPLSEVASDRLDELAVKLRATNAETSYAIHSNYRGSDSDSSSDTSYYVFEDDNLKEVLEDLKVDAQCLMDLDPLFKNPALDLSLTKQKVVETIEWAPEKVYCEKVQQRFPQASSSLVLRLGEANWACYLRLQNQRNARDEPTESASQNVDTGTIAGSKFHDSGIGTSLPTATSYAETVMTYTAETDGQKIRIPPLPEDAKRGESFECIACARFIRVRSTRSWKSHLMSDLKPYICLEEGCTQVRFDTREDWVSHLHLDHGYSSGSDSMPCPLCCEQLRHLTIVFHLGRHLEEISLSVLPVNADEGEDEDENDGGDNAVVGFDSANLSPTPSLTAPPSISAGSLPQLAVDDEDEGDERKYCLCQNVSYGDMAACDNDDCPYEWFHWSCVGLKSEPKGSWYCPVCNDAMRKKETGTAPRGQMVSDQRAAQVLESQYGKRAAASILAIQSGIQSKYQGQHMPPGVSNSNSGNNGDELDDDGSKRWHRPSPYSLTEGEREKLDKDLATLRETIATAAPAPAAGEARRRLIAEPESPSKDAGGITSHFVREPQQSIYWSVRETKEFPELLRRFGTDWAAIAAHMKTKSPLMVKNYYVRQAGEFFGSGGVSDLQAIAREADERRSPQRAPTQLSDGKEPEEHKVPDAAIERFEGFFPKMPTRRERSTMAASGQAPPPKQELEQEDAIEESTNPRQPQPGVPPYEDHRNDVHSIQDLRKTHANTQRYLSCGECRRRKQRCDGDKPCSNCKRRFPQPSCEYNKPLAKLATPENQATG